ncbi:MAG: hypothetical protein RLY20_1219 [Verrucomicrobiota bacterium]|jgi:hypothetical protein
MKLVFTSTEVPELQMIHDMMERAGLPCELRSSSPLDALGGEPFSAELWVRHDADLARARKLFEDWTLPSAHATGNWICPGCHIKLSAAFDSCWKCGSSRPITR